jgi:hypothetical protein
MNMNASPLIGPPVEPTPRPLLDHNPDFSRVYRRGMASQAGDQVNLEIGISRPAAHHLESLWY